MSWILTNFSTDFSENKSQYWSFFLSHCFFINNVFAQLIDTKCFCMTCPYKENCTCLSLLSEVIFFFSVSAEITVCKLEIAFYEGNSTFPGTVAINVS